jgi:hypothetical protein
VSIALTYTECYHPYECLNLSECKTDSGFLFLESCPRVANKYCCERKITPHRNILTTTSTTEATTEATTEGTTEGTAEGTTKADPFYEEDKKFDLDSCGPEPKLNRIANGQDANVIQYPWFALIGYQDSGEIKFKCGGSLINRKF